MENTGKVVIIGAGETAALAYEYFTHDSAFSVAGFSVEEKYLEVDTFLGLPVVPFENMESYYHPGQYQAFIAISSTQLNRVRTRLFQSVKEKGYRCVSYVSSRAFVWHNVEIGENCFILEDNTIQPFVKIGDNVILWSGNHVGHRTIIRDNCFIASHVVISGYCDIGENCFVGVNSTIINNIIVAKDCLIGAGVLIQRNTEEKKVYKIDGTELSRVSNLRPFREKE